MEHRLERVYRDHAPALFRFLLRLTGHEADTRDVLQDIFVRLAQSPRLLEGVVAPRSFLIRMAHRLVIDRSRREKTRRMAADRAAEEAPSAADPAPLAEEARWRQKAVEACLAALPLEQKAVVVLKIWEEMTFAEIAATLELSPHTAASRYRYALDKLREALRPLHEDQP
jgi:RNA polymerase sigma-70 factor (ECF subfamily)